MSHHHHPKTAVPTSRQTYKDAQKQLVPAVYANHFVASKYDTKDHNEVGQLMVTATSSHPQ